MKYLGVNIWYGRWGGLGLVVRSVVWVIIFKENINVISIFWIRVIIIGVVVVNVFGWGE